MNNNEIIKKLKQKNITGDLYFEKNWVKSISFENDFFKSTEMSESEGYGLRIKNSEEKEGFSCSNSLDESIVDKVLDLSHLGEQVSYDFPYYNENEYSDMNLWNEEIININGNHLIEEASNIIDKHQATIPLVKTNIDITYGYKEYQLLNTSELDLNFKKTFYSVSVMGNLANNDQITDIYEFQVNNGQKFNLDFLSNELIQKFQLAQNNAKITSGEYPIIFTPKAMRSFINILLTGFNGKLIEKGVSPIIDRINKKIGVNELNIIDDKLNSYLTATAPFDGDGMPAQSKFLIKEGTILDGIYDIKTASRMGKQSTANSVRSYSSLPSISTHNIIVESGNSDLEKMIDSVKEGIIVDQFIGAGQSNVLAGEFSANIDLGFLIKNGEKVGRVKDTMINGNVFDMISKITSISSENITFGSSQFPYILFDQCSVVS